MPDHEHGDDIERGVALLRVLEQEELPLDEVVDRLEAVTVHPRKTREILREATERGVISRDRDQAAVRPLGDVSLNFESDVVSREGEFACQRCGESLSTGYFMQVEAGEIGAFGSTCIRKVTGRE
jgi:hypothetical protein